MPHFAEPASRIGPIPMELTQNIPLRVSPASSSWWASRSRREVRLPLLWREEEEEEVHHAMVHKSRRHTNWQTHKKKGITWCLIKDWTLNLSQIISHFSALQCHYMHLYFSNILKLTCNEFLSDSSMTSFHTWFYDILHHLRQNTSATSNRSEKTPAGLG